MVIGTSILGRRKKEKCKHKNKGKTSFGQIYCIDCGVTLAPSTEKI